MRNVFIASAVLAAMLPATAAAAAPDVTVGTGTYGSSTQSLTVQVSAQSEDGGNPRGHVRIEQVAADPAGSFNVYGTVVCHRVVGNAAVVTAVLDEPLFGGFVQAMRVWVIDDGEPGAGQDDMRVGSVTSGSWTSCELFSGGFNAPLAKGNFEVQDH